MQSFRIKRTRHEDLVFTGKLLASVDEKNRAEHSLVRLQLDLYQTIVKAYILSIILNDYRSSNVKTLYGAISFAKIEDIHDFILTREGRGISDLVHMLLEQITKTQNSFTEDSGQDFISEADGRNEPYQEVSGQ